MGEIEKAVLGSVRLDSDVWEAVRAMPFSLNVYLREQLLNGKAITPEIEARIAANVRPRRQSKKEKVIQTLRDSDVTAKEVGREDIEYGPHTEREEGGKVSEIEMHLCETDSDCGHRIPKDAYDSLDNWREEDNRDRDDDLYIVRSECAGGFPVLQRYGNYCVIRGKQ